MSKKPNQKMQAWIDARKRRAPTAGPGTGVTPCVHEIEDSPLRGGTDGSAIDQSLSSMPHRFRIRNAFDRQVLPFEALRLSDTALEIACKVLPGFQQIFVHL